jgi:membrane-bound serine protease (ClpP class)
VVGVSPFVVLTIAVLFGAGLATVATKVVAARHAPAAAIGLAGMVGREAVVRTPLTPLGEVYVEGALWQAQSDNGRAGVGDMVIVRAVDGLLLHVEPVPAEVHSTEGAVQ